MPDSDVPAEGVSHAAYRDLGIRNLTINPPDPEPGSFPHIRFDVFNAGTGPDAVGINASDNGVFIWWIPVTPALLPNESRGADVSVSQATPGEHLLRVYFADHDRDDNASNDFAEIKFTVENYPPPPPKWPEIEGFVLDASTGKGVANATVDIGWGGLWGTASDGSYSGSAPNGTHGMTVTAPGYQTLGPVVVNVSWPDRLWFNFTLQPERNGPTPVVVDPVILLSSTAVVLSAMALFIAILTWRQSRRKRSV